MKIAGYEVTKDGWAALAHGVIDPNAWIEHVAANFPPMLAAEHIANKVRVCATRWIADGKPTKTRAQREAEDEAILAPSANDIRLQHELKLMKLRVELAAADGLKLAQEQLKEQIVQLEGAMRSVA